jgi:RNA-binding protein
MPRSRQALRRQARVLSPAIQVGKAGITPGLITEIKNQLKHTEVIKLRLGRAFLAEHDRKQAAQELADLAKAVLVQQIGFVVVLARRPKSNS